MTAAEFWSGFAPKYDEWYATPAAKREDRTVLNMLSPLLDSQRVLDVGCGTGALLDQIGLPPGGYLGVDISEAMLNVARGKHRSEIFLRRNWDDRVDLLNLYGVAVCAFAFNFFAHPQVAMANFARAIPTGGTLFLVLLQPRRLLSRTCPLRFNREVKTRFYGRRTFTRGGMFRVVADRPFALTAGYERPKIEDAVVRRLPLLAQYRILVCERI